SPGQGGRMLHAMIMAGGGGTRFWPRSRQRRPKQFLTLAGDRSLLQQAYYRLEGLAPGRTWVITSEAHVAETANQLPEVSADHIRGEPCGRDPAPCIGLGAALIAREDADAVMMVTPADHVIEPMREFTRAAQVAEQMAREFPQSLITFGIPPTYASTGYGYPPRGAGRAATGCRRLSRAGVQGETEGAGGAPLRRDGRILLE